MDWEEGARLIDDCSYLFATEVRESEELTLVISLAEAKVQARQAVVAGTDPILAGLFVNAHPIEPDSTCRRFQVTFLRHHMVSYTVLDETYGRYPKAPEVFTGKLFRRFTKSHLLDCGEG